MTANACRPILFPPPVIPPTRNFSALNLICFSPFTPPGSPPGLLLPAAPVCNEGFSSFPDPGGLLIPRSESYSPVLETTVLKKPLLNIFNLTPIYKTTPHSEDTFVPKNMLLLILKPCFPYRIVKTRAYHAVLVVL